MNVDLVVLGKTLILSTNNHEGILEKPRKQITTPTARHPLPQTVAIDESLLSCPA